MLTANAVEFIMDGVLAGKISRAVALLLVSPYVAGDELVSGVVLSGAQNICDFAMTRDALELTCSGEELIRLELLHPELFESDEEVRVRVEKWRALRESVDDMREEDTLGW